MRVAVHIGEGAVRATTLMVALVIGLTPTAVLAGDADASEARLQVSGLTPGDVVTTPLLTLTVTPLNFDFSPLGSGGADIEAGGHYRIHLDDHLSGMYTATEAVVDLHDLMPGPHVLTLSPATNDEQEILDGVVRIAFDYEPTDDVATDDVAADQTVVISLTEMSLTPDTLTLAPGHYTFEARNDGAIGHALWITGQDLQAGTPDSSYAPGQTESFSVDLAPGTYQLVCPVQWHKAQGMVGTLVVSE